MRLVLRARGPAPAEAAWERYADLRAWPAWSPQIAGVDVEGPLRLRAGLRGAVLGPRLLGRPLLVAAFVVEEVDAAARRWSWAVEPRRVLLPVPRAVGRWARLRLVHAVTGTEQGSATALELHGPAPVVLGYAGPAWVALRNLVR